MQAKFPGVRYDTAVNGSGSMMRIYRDVRFSKNKHPYKLNLGAAIIAGGRKTGRAGYYVHVQPGESILAGGIYHPQDNVLKGVRKLIDKEGEEIKKIVNKPLFKKYFGEIVGDRLKRSPKDYDEDHAYIEFLRQKDFLAVHKMSDSAVNQKDFAKFAAKVFRELKAFDDFFNSVIKVGKR